MEREMAPAVSGSLEAVGEGVEMTEIEVVLDAGKVAEGA